MLPNQAKYLKISLVFLLVVGIGVTVYLIQFTQIFKPKANQSDTCTASDPASFKDCLNQAQNNGPVNNIEITKQIVCTSKEECSNNFDAAGKNLGGFVLDNRTNALTIFGTPGTAAGFKRMTYDYVLLWIGTPIGTEVKNVTLKDLIFDETTTECDFLNPSLGDAKCNSPLAFGFELGSKITNTTIDHITVLHSKNFSLQIGHADTLTIKNSIIYDSKRDGIWFDSAYPRKADLSPDCPSVVICPIDTTKANKNITIENNLIAQSDISAIEFYGIGTQQSPNYIRGNLFVHNHHNAKYIVQNGCDGHCPGGQVAVSRSSWVIIEDNVVRDGVIDSIKPYDQYGPRPYIQNATYDSLGLVGSGIELSSQINNIIIRNNRVFNFKGVAYPDRGSGVFADYVGTENQVSAITVTGNNLYNNAAHFAAAGHPHFESEASAYGFTYTNNTINNPSGGPIITKAFIFADPPACVPQNGGQCSSTIRWFSNNYDDLKINVKDAPNSVFATGPYGSQEANWITAKGAGFELRDKSNNTLLGQTQVNGSGVSSTITPLTSANPTSTIFPHTFLSAVPNPCILNSNQTCTSTISWNYNAGSNIKISVKENPGSIIASVGPGSSSQQVSWITASGATFQLYADGVLKDELFVNGIPHNNMITASPATCDLNSEGTCTSRIIWSYPNATNLKISVREQPGSLFAQAPTGATEVPWITATGATFDAYSGNTLLGSVFVKGVGGSAVSSPAPSASGRRPGDINGDGKVDILDFNLYIPLFRAKDQIANLDNISQVDIRDFNIMVQLIRQP